MLFAIGTSIMASFRKLERRWRVGGALWRSNDRWPMMGRRLDLLIGIGRNWPRNWRWFPLGRNAGHWLPSPGGRQSDRNPGPWGPIRCSSLCNIFLPLSFDFIPLDARRKLVFLNLHFSDLLNSK